jgi:hypothetical protein
LFFSQLQCGFLQQLVISNGANLPMQPRLFPFHAIAISLIAIFAQAQEGGAGDEIDVRVLEHYVGKWDVAIEDSAQKVTRGSLLDESGKPYLKILDLMSYDPSEKCFRMWTFDSSQSLPFESRGTWDATTKTMTWTRKISLPASSIIRTTTLCFANPRRTEWATYSTDEKGEKQEGLKGAFTLKPESGKAK